MKKVLFLIAVLITTSAIADRNFVVDKYQVKITNEVVNGSIHTFDIFTTLVVENTGDPYPDHQKVAFECSKKMYRYIDRGQFVPDRSIAFQWIPITDDLTDHYIKVAFTHVCKSNK